MSFLRDFLKNVVGPMAGGTEEQPLDAIASKLNGPDVSQVRAHADGVAADASQQLGAKAFTAGIDTFADRSGLHTAAHEATHALQQTAGKAVLQAIGTTKGSAAPAPSGILIHPQGTVELQQGAKIQIHAKAKFPSQLNQKGEPTTVEQDVTSAVVWSSDNPKVVSIDAAGVATGAASGTTKINAVDKKNGFSDSVTVTVATT